MTKLAPVILALLASAAGCSVFGSDDAEVPPVVLGDDPRPAPGRDAPAPLTGTPEETELSETFGVFVSTTGRPDGDGSRATPLRSIADAIAMAAPAAKRVYVCEGDYEEAVVLADAVSVIGGLDCSKPDSWKAGSGVRSRVLAPSSPAVLARDIVSPTRFEGFDVKAPAGTAEATSSIGLLAARAPGLRVVASRIEAGDAHAGADGVEGAKLAFGSAAPAGNGAGSTYWPAGTIAGFAVQLPGGAGQTATCAGGPPVEPEAGGRGEWGGVYECRRIGLSDPKWRAHRALVAASGSGAAGAAGVDGAAGARVGVFDEQGYTPADGAAGTDGDPGHGGLGGEANSLMAEAACSTSDIGRFLSAGGGGGGGAGGCPGVAGGEGKGGGASVGALVLASPGLAFERAELVAGAGGAGGRGTFGSSPTRGGTPGRNELIGVRLPTAGGAGGRAGVSGSGGGGPSIALVHDGQAPALTHSSTTEGRPGAGVAAATSSDALGNVRTRAASADGLAARVHAL